MNTRKSSDISNKARTLAGISSSTTQTDLKPSLAERPHCYVGHHPECGCLVAVVFDDPRFKKDTAKSVAEFIKTGYAVTRISLADYRERGAYGHECAKKKVRG